MLTRQALHEFLKTAICEEVKTMIGDKYIRCGNRSVAIVKHLGRNEGPYALCESCARHNLDNRGAVLVQTCSDYGLDGL